MFFLENVQAYLQCYISVKIFCLFDFFIGNKKRFLSTESAY